MKKKNLSMNERMRQYERKNELRKGTFKKDTPFAKWYERPLQLWEHLGQYKYPVISFRSEYGRFTVATISPKLMFPDEDLMEIRGDFNADWTTDKTPKFIKENIKDSSTVYWWCFD